MLAYLFPRLTGRERRGQPLFDAAVAEARRRHWYVEGGVADDLDGRFAMLATICALVSVRLEGSEDAGGQSAALTERFVEAMDAEHRQMGLNDPALGKRVRTLVGVLALRVGEWREAAAGEERWDEAVLASVYGGEAPGAGQLAHSSEKLRELWRRLQASAESELAEGRF